MSNAFEYGDALLPPPKEDGSETPIESNQPYMSLATFRMVVLAEEVLEAFFEQDLSASFRLEPVPLMDLPAVSTSTSLLGGLWGALATDDNKKLFNKFSDELGRAVGKHQVIHRPSIGRFTNNDEPRPRESLLMPGMRRSPSQASLTPTDGSSTLAPTESSASLATPRSGTPQQKEKPLPGPPPSISIKDADKSKAERDAQTALEMAQAALMERPQFAIDDAGDEDEDFESDVEDGDEVLDAVDAFLEEQEKNEEEGKSGLSAAEQAAAQGTFRRRILYC